MQKEEHTGDRSWHSLRGVLVGLGCGLGVVSTSGFDSECFQR